MMIDKENYKLYKGDCLENIKYIPNKSVDLVLIDPPYNISKAEWDKWDTVEDYISFMGKTFLEIQRVLKDNGSFYFFHNDFLQMAELQHWINQNTEFKFKSLITWNKTKYKNFAWKNRNPDKCKDRNWFPNVEYIMFYTLQSETGLDEVLRQDGFIKLMNYFKDERLKLGWSYSKCDEFLGIKASYCYWDKPTTHQYRIPDERHYKKLQETGLFKKSYEELKDEYEYLKREYEHLRYTFNLNEVQDNISCVWEFDNISNIGKFHPCEKPQNILQKIILTSSNKDDVVLDCFMGSGSTGVVALSLNRRFIGIELNENYFNIAKNRIEELS